MASGSVHRSNSSLPQDKLTKHLLVCAICASKCKNTKILKPLIRTKQDRLKQMQPRPFEQLTSPHCFQEATCEKRNVTEKSQRMGEVGLIL